MSQSSIILPERPTKDPNIAPVRGNKGPCLLCNKYSKLSEAHIFPKSVGNKGPFLAKGFMTSSIASNSRILNRRFINGVCFKTLCAECNNNIGGKEDKELSEFFAAVRCYIFSKLPIKPSLAHFKVRPNVLIKAVLVHLLSANDRGVPSLFDEEVRAIILSSKNLRETKLRVFYWPYTGKWLTVVRDISVTENVQKIQNSDWLQVIKLKPLGFAVTDSCEFRGLPCLNNFITNHDSQTIEIPININRIDKDRHWPAETSINGLMLSGDNTSGFIATPSWRT